MKLALVLPAGTVTDGGTVATAVSLLARATAAPPAGAAILSVTLPVDAVPPVTAAGFTLSAMDIVGITASREVAVAPP